MAKLYVMVGLPGQENLLGQARKDFRYILRIVSGKSYMGTKLSKEMAKKYSLSCASALPMTCELVKTASVTQPI